MPRALKLTLTAGLVLAVLVVLGGVVFKPAKTQWDFKVYDACASAMARGEDPYAKDQVIGGLDYPCLYPPLSIDLYRPFAALSRRTGGAWGQYLWSVFEILMLGLLLAVWKRWLPDRWHEVLPLAFIAFAYGSPLHVSFRAGNIAIFEMLLVWAGLSALVEDKDELFAFCIILTAQMKIIPAGFLGLLILRDKPRWGLFAGSSAACVGLFALNELVHPGMLSGYFELLFVIDKPWRYEAGVSNPSAMAFIKEVLGAFSGVRGGGPAAKAVFAVYAAGMLGASAWAGRKLFLDWSKAPALRRRETVYYFCLVYALLAPRFKDYSYILVILPTLHFILTDRSRLRWAVLAVAMVNSTQSLAEKAGLEEIKFLFAYFKLYALALTWYGCTRRLQKDAADPAA